MRILVTSTAGTGHVHPLVPLAQAARAAGHELHWAVAEPARPSLERLGLTTRAAGLGVPERRAEFARQFGAELASVPPNERRAIAFTGHFARLSAPRMLADLSPLMDELRPDVIVHETAELAGPLLAETAGIPHVAVAFSGMLPASADAAAAAALAPLRSSLGLPTAPRLGLAHHAYFHPFPPAMGQRPPGATVHDLRPMGEDGSAGEERPRWLGSVGRARPLVYVTFGTEMGPLAPWAALVPALAALDHADVVVTIGAALDPAALGPLPPHVRVERYVPQGWLLPACSLVVSHAGAGTLLASVAHGVPQLLVPLGADQFENAVAYLGTGAGASGFGLDATALTEAALRLLGDGDHRTAAARLAAECAAMPGPVQACEVIERLVG